MSINKTKTKIITLVNRRKHPSEYEVNTSNRTDRALTNTCEQVAISFGFNCSYPNVCLQRRHQAKSITFFNLNDNVDLINIHFLYIKIRDKKPLFQ